MLKDHVLTCLLQAEGFLSGASVSRDLQVSRAAVNQAVKALRDEGYVIDSVTNRGYRLISGPDRITPGSLQALIGEKRMERVFCYDSTDSTNRRLQEAMLNGDAPHGLIAVANEQTAGRGRLGRSFASPQDMGIYMSVLLWPQVLGDASPSSSWTALTSWTAVAVCRAIEAVYDVQPGIKWVNDLYLGGKKICGILTQMDLETERGLIRDIIIGIGINVQEQENDFPEELREIAGSLYQQTGKRIDRTILAAEMIRQLDRLCEDWSDPESAAVYLNTYRKHSLVTGKPVSVIRAGNAKEATAVCIGDDFSLHVQYPDGTAEILRGGEISIRSSAIF